MTALITGANRGLGRAAALHLADAGHDIHLTYRRHADEARAVAGAIEARGRRATVHQLDAGDISRFDALADAVDALDVLVLNAGGGFDTPFGEVDEQQFDDVFDVHVKGAFFLAQALLPKLGDGASIVFLSTALTRFASPGQSVYGAAKGAVEVLTRQLARELGPRGIRVNAIAPGPIGTDFNGGFMRDDDGFRTSFAPNVALGRIGEPDDVGAAIAHLVASRWVTAQRVEVSGGTLI